MTLACTEENLLFVEMELAEMSGKSFFAACLVVLMADIFAVHCQDPRDALAKASGKPSGRQAVYDIFQYGAAGDGQRLDTKAIQAAVDACAKAGGGRVHLHNGTFLSGTIFLKNNVSLFIDSGATLLGSTDLKDYPAVKPAHRSWTDRNNKYADKALLYAERIENLSVVGPGTIDGQGRAKPYQRIRPETLRPYVIHFVECKGVRVRDVNLRDSPFWMQHYQACEDLVIDNVTVHSRVRANRDGLNIDGCRNVRVSNCDIFSGDDSIVLKSTSDRICENVVITNCVLSSKASAIKLGTESHGGFRNISISNCVIYGGGFTGIALMSVDGGVLDGVTISNITMRGINIPLFIRLGDRGRIWKEGLPRPGVGAVRNIMITNVQAVDAGRFGCSITGLAGHPVENVTLSNVRFLFKGGGTLKDAARTIPELRGNYPGGKMFGVLPAYGLFCREVKNVRLDGVELGFASPDHRPALICEHVRELDVSGFRAGSTSLATAVMTLRNTRNAFIHGCRAVESTGRFLRVEGEQSSNISLKQNDLAGAQWPLVQGDEVGKDAVRLGPGGK
jgi:hypothetical protein